MNVFVDGSYSPQEKFGVGAYLFLSPEEMLIYKRFGIRELKTMLAKEIMYCVFEEAIGSTGVEQRALEIALTQVQTQVVVEKVTSVVDLRPIVYTDCQKTQTNIDYRVVHIKGHDPQRNRIGASKIFDIIDKAARKKLRTIIRGGE